MDRGRSGMTCGHGQQSGGFGWAAEVSNSRTVDQWERRAVELWSHRPVAVTTITFGRHAGECFLLRHMYFPKSSDQHCLFPRSYSA